MARQKFEFYCTSCCKYFDVKLNLSLNGNYRIHCPTCDHTHYREIKNGEITDIRFPENDDKILIEDIRPMKSSCRDFQTEIVGDCLQTDAGFMSRLWNERFSGKT